MKVNVWGTRLLVGLRDSSCRKISVEAEKIMDTNDLKITIWTAQNGDCPKQNEVSIHGHWNVDKSGDWSVFQHGDDLYINATRPISEEHLRGVLRDWIKSLGYLPCEDRVVGIESVVGKEFMIRGSKIVPIGDGVCRILSRRVSLKDNRIVIFDDVYEQGDREIFTCSDGVWLASENSYTIVPLQGSGNHPPILFCESTVYVAMRTYPANEFRKDEINTSVDEIATTFNVWLKKLGYTVLERK